MSELISAPTRKMHRCLSLKEQKIAEEARTAEVKRVEESMRMLFFGEIINQGIVDQYNALEARWKKLNKQ